MVVHPFVELLSAGEHPIGIPGTRYLTVKSINKMTNDGQLSS